jgi:Transposase.
MDDAPQPSRPRTFIATTKFILKTMLKNLTTRSWSCNRIAMKVSRIPGWQPVSPSTIYQVLKEHGYRVYKRTVKPGLIEEQMKERLEWCLKYKDWTLKDWKNVIWTDETSVQLGGV